ncbi:hypothetical protein EJB05_15098, partial [Eragrostis curvula]
MDVHMSREGRKKRDLHAGPAPPPTRKIRKTKGNIILLRDEEEKVACRLPRPQVGGAVLASPFLPPSLLPVRQIRSPPATADLCCLARLAVGVAERQI